MNKLMGMLIIVLLAGIVFFLMFYPEHLESEKSIKAYLASTLPVVDGIKSEGEWDDTVFYEFKWGSEEQNITDGTLCLTIGFKFNQTHLFVLATINDNDFDHSDALLLIFDSDNNVSDDKSVSGYPTEHLDMFAENGSIGSNETGGFCVREDGAIIFLRGGIYYLEDQPVNCTYVDGTYTFEGAFKLDRLNLTSSKLNIVYIEYKSPYNKISLVNPVLPSEYYNFSFIESMLGKGPTSECQKGDNKLQFEIYLVPSCYGFPSNEFPPGEPIEIVCILANEGASNVNVLRMEVGTLAIDFEMVTPEGCVLHYAGPYWWHVPHVDTLAPGTCEILTIDITDSSYPDPVYYFRTDNIEHYEFTTEGDYSIRGIYRSDPSLVGDKSVENCLLYSTVRNFTIG